MWEEINVYIDRARVYYYLIINSGEHINIPIKMSCLKKICWNAENAEMGKGEVNLKELLKKA